jgi:hypothetical protein
MVTGMNNIREITTDALEMLMRFRTSYDVARYLLDQSHVNWREFENGLESDYPIKGCGVIADRVLVSNWTMTNETLLQDEQDIGSHEVSDELSTYPLETASLVYMFSLLEEYGNEVTRRVNSAFLKDRSAWHRKVFIPDGDPTNIDLKRMQIGFAAAFNLEPTMVQLPIASALGILKDARNYIVHKREAGYDFAKAFSAVVAIICHIYFLVTKDDEPLKVYPWYDYQEHFT